MKIAAELKHANAMDIRDFSQFDMIYNFNALPRRPLAIVLDNIVDSVRRSRKEVIILFSNFQAQNRDLLARPEIAILGEMRRTTDYLLARVHSGL